MYKFKIVLSILFVFLVAFFVVRGCVTKKEGGLHEKPIKKKQVDLIKKIKRTPAPRKEAYPVIGKMAIVLDDWGNNYPLLQTAIDTEIPLTLAILPELSHSRQIANEAYKNRLGVMLHMPMQPKSGGVKLEPWTILTTTPDREIISYLNKALLSVPHAEGVNNHMGSAATSDERVMRVVLKHLKSKKLFFIDSNTISTTVAPQIAKEIGIRFTQRDVFIDNNPELNAVKAQLEKAKSLALKRGKVLVIGHDKKNTLQAIKEVIPNFKKEGIKFVLAKEIVE